jgi:hypothetical protein
MPAYQLAPQRRGASEVRRKQKGGSLRHRPFLDSSFQAHESANPE